MTRRDVFWSRESAEAEARVINAIYEELARALFGWLP